MRTAHDLYPGGDLVRAWFREMAWLIREYRKCGRELKDFERKMKEEGHWDSNDMSKHPFFVRVSKYLK